METTPTEKDNRTHHIMFRVTASEFAFINDRAASLGLKRTDYARQLILGYTPREQLDATTRRNLVGIGTNLNQFMKRINLGFDERELVLQVVGEIDALLTKT